MLIAILMSLNIVSVGYATWAITGPSTSEAGGSFDSYPVIKSDDYYTLTPTVYFQSYFNNADGTQGYFLLVDKNGNLVETPSATEATIELTYAKQKELTSPKITTTVVFVNPTTSEAFFDTVNVTVKRGNEELANNDNITGGVLSFTFEPNAGTTLITITLEATGSLNTDLLSGTGAKQFIFNTTVQGTPAN